MRTIELQQPYLTPYLRTTDDRGFICGEKTRDIFRIPYNAGRDDKFFTLKATEKNPKKKGWIKAQVNSLYRSSYFYPCDTSGNFTIGKATTETDIWIEFYNFCLPFEGKTVWFKIEEKKA